MYDQPENSMQDKIQDESDLLSYLLWYSSPHSSLLLCCAYGIDPRTGKQGQTDATHMYQPPITKLLELFKFPSRCVNSEGLKKLFNPQTIF